MNLEDLNQSYTEQLERRVSDLNITVALLKKEREEAQKLAKQKESDQLRLELEKKDELISRLIQKAE